MSFDSDYTVQGRMLSSGSSADIVRCTSRRTGVPCVAKMYRKHKVSDHRVALGREEGQLGLSIPPNARIVQTLNVYEDDSAVTVVTEYLPEGTLFETLCDSGALGEVRAAKLLAQVLEALMHLHGCGVMHRDIKPENILFRSKAGRDGESLAIGDLGFATRKIPSDNCVGSPQYSAPELALIGLQLHAASNAKPLYNEKCDIWSTGVVAFVMMTGLMPFDGPTPTEVFQSVVRNQMPFTLPASKKLSQGARDFILALTHTNPSKRPSAKEALQHPWIRSSLGTR